MPTRLPDRSERQLMRHAADRLSIRWYIRYDLGELMPDHSSLTRIRERYGVDTFRRFFEAIMEQCQQAGLIWGKELYIDATKVEANASLASVKPRFFVEAHLATLFDAQTEGAQEEADQRTPQVEMPVERLLDVGANISMSTPGQPTENAFAESFFKTLSV